VIPSHINSQKLKRKNIISYVEFRLTNSSFYIKISLNNARTIWHKHHLGPVSRCDNSCHDRWNTSQNDNSDWIPFHWTTSDKRNATSKLQQSDSKYEKLDKGLFHKDAFLSETLGFV